MADTAIAVFLLLLLLLVKLAYRRDRTEKYGAPFVPLEPSVVSEVLKLADIKPGDIFYDLGSGDGRLVIAAALQGARAYGVEIDPVRVFYSRLWIFLFGLWNRAKIIKGDLFAVDLSDADVITSYLLQETNNELQSKIEKETRTGTRIVGIAFNFPGWKPVTVNPRGPVYGPLYLYKKTGRPGKHLTKKSVGSV